MKRLSVFLPAVAALAMTACSKSETEGVAPAAQTKAIGFESLVNKSSRALDNTNFRKFKVYGTYHADNKENEKVQIFNAVDVSKNSETGKWEYSPARYWIKDMIYDFYAFSCDSKVGIDQGKGNANFNSTEGYVLNIAQFIANQNHQDDIVFAKVNGVKAQETGNAVVAFSFKHILSRVNLKFQYDYPKESGYELTVSDVAVTQMRDVGTFKGATMAWDPTTVNRTTEDITEVPEILLDFNQDSGTASAEVILTESNASATTEWGYVIPYEYKSANVGIKFSLMVKNSVGETVLNKTYSCALQPKWEMGTAYGYVVKLSADAAGYEKIEFSVDPDSGVDDWKTGTTGGDINISTPPLDK